MTIADPGKADCLARLGLAQRPHGSGGRQHRQRLDCPGDLRIGDLEVPVLAALVNLQEAGLDQPGEVKARRRRAEPGEGGKLARGQLTVLPQRQQQPDPGRVGEHARHRGDGTPPQTRSKRGEGHATMTGPRASTRTVPAFYQHAVNRRDFAAAAQFLAPVLIRHRHDAADAAEGLREFIDRMRTAYPRSHCEIKRVFADGDYVILHVHVVREWL